MIRLSATLCLLLLPALVPRGAAAQATPDPAEAVAEVRAASNAALAAGDLEAFMASVDGDYVGTGGSGGHARSREALRDIIEGGLAQDPRLHYVRTPGSIEVGPEGVRAMEEGRWIEIAGGPGGEPTGVAGRYAAYWRRDGGAWVIHAELFVTLGADQGG